MDEIPRREDEKPFYSLETGASAKVNYRASYMVCYQANLLKSFYDPLAFKIQ